MATNLIKETIIIKFGKIVLFTIQLSSWNWTTNPNPNSNLNPNKWDRIGQRTEPDT